MSQLPTQMMLENRRLRASEAKPFLRWAGGKRPFLRSNSDELPTFSGTYIEPFLGSGAVFFFLSNRQGGLDSALLGDTNPHLVSLFEAVRDRPDELFDDLLPLATKMRSASCPQDVYYALREQHNQLLPARNPALFLALNRTCWNGVYRENSLGHFNVPYGAPRLESCFPTLDDLLNASAALRTAKVRCTSWENVLAQARPGDFVFLDPPYFSELSAEGPMYGGKAFSQRDHEKLAQAARSLGVRGIEFLLSSSAEDEMVDLYDSYGLEVRKTLVSRTISRQADQRKASTELIVSNLKVERDTKREGEVLARELSRINL
jgi:DNA adenine methylase